jgi:hypothetical protein
MASRRRRASSAARSAASGWRLCIGDVLARLLPHGSRGGRTDPRRPWREESASWQSCPAWPPDLFAVAATLVQRSGAYAYRSRDAGRRATFGRAYLERVTRAGAAWRAEPTQPPQDLWDRLHAVLDEPFDTSTADWWAVALELMAVADEAAWGMGYVIDAPEPSAAPPERGESPFAAAVVEAYRELARQERATAPLEHLPASLCWLVPPAECCVLPKACTPQVGVTLAALSHHLALLPSAAEVHPRWLVNPLERELPRQGHGTFNLLIVPYPYRIHGSAFLPADSAPAGPRGRRFAVRQDWLSATTPTRLARFVAGLAEVARREVGTVDGVALPELALDVTHFEAVGRALGRAGVHLLVAGVHARQGPSSANQVRTALYSRDGRPLTHISQNKHHRWKLDAGQIRRYHVGHALDPAEEWWEATDVDRRECSFLQISKGAVVATLVCEDLARIEPVQTILRSVGPNLVIAVLMDGPQLEWRWPGRSATVLADDPGSAVLTLTSFGMVRRSVMPGDAEPREIALWKEPLGQARPLQLPRDRHALLLSLTLGFGRDYTLDGRDDGGSSVRVALGGVHGVAHPDPPAWLEC